MRKLFLGLLLLASPAAAADLNKAPPPPPPLPAVAVESAFDGIYVGGNVGYSWLDGSLSAITRGGFNLGGTQKAAGIQGGAQLGYGKSIGPLYLGLATDYSLTGASGGGTNMPWYGTARLRAGFLASPNWLIYATGGAAYGQVNTSTALRFATLDTHLMGVGWAAGAGVEMALTKNWHTGVEYLHTNLYGPSASAATPFALIPAKSSAFDDGLRLKVNYLF